MKSTNYKCTIYASYLGYITQAVVNNFAPLLFLIFRDSMGISLEKITLLIITNFMIQLLVDLLSAKFVDKIGYRKCILGAHVFAAAGLIGMAVFPQIFSDKFIGLFLAAVFYGIGGGLIEVLISPIVEACPTENKASIMSLLHSFYCWGTVAVVLCSTLFLKVVGQEHWKELALVWAVLPIINTFFFAKVPISQLTEEGEAMSVKKLFSGRIFWIFMLLMVCAGAAEQGMSQWASAFAESGLGVSKTVGDLAGPCMFSILMGCARAFYAKAGEKIDLLSFIIGSSVLCIVAYFLASFSPVPAISLAGCGLCGLSVGILWPGVFSIASEKYPKGGTVMFALLALAGDLGCSGGPALVGMVSGIFEDNLKMGLVMAEIFPLTLIVCALLYRNIEK
ncbi:MAG: MFS transporter [Lachnospiraceae bacterium]|nr:MFS transporter [Lachnospiraceae bacterium]